MEGDSARFIKPYPSPSHLRTDFMKVAFEVGGLSTYPQSYSAFFKERPTLLLERVTFQMVGLVSAVFTPEVLRDLVVAVDVVIFCYWCGDSNGCCCGCGQIRDGDDGFGSNCCAERAKMTRQTRT